VDRSDFDLYDWALLTFYCIELHYTVCQNTEQLQHRWV